MTRYSKISWIIFAVVLFSFCYLSRKRHETRENFLTMSIPKVHGLPLLSSAGLVTVLLLATKAVFSVLTHSVQAATMYRPVDTIPPKIYEGWCCFPRIPPCSAPLPPHFLRAAPLRGSGDGLHFYVGHAIASLFSVRGDI